MIENSLLQSMTIAPYDREFFDFLSEGYLETDLAGLIRQANRAAAILLRVNQEALIGQSLLDFMAGEPAEHQTWQNQIAELIRLRQLQTWEVNLQPPNTAPVLTNLTVSVISEAGGQTVGLRWLLKNVAESGQTEAAFENKIRELDLANGQTLIYARELIGEITQHRQAQSALARRAEEMAALYETSLEINNQPDLSTLFQVIVHRAAALLETNQSGIFILRPDNKTLEMVAAHNQQGDFQGVVVQLGQGLAGRVAQTGQALAVSDYKNWPGKIEPLKFGPIGRILGVPLKKREQVIGVLTVLDDVNDVDFTEDGIRLLSLFANQAAVAIERAQLANETQLQLRRLTLINRLASEMTGLLEMDDLYTTVTQQLQTAFNFLNVAIFSVDSTTHQLVLQAITGAYADRAQPGKYRQAIGQGVIGQAAQAEAVLIINDTRQYPEFFELEQSTIFSELAMPLRVGEQLFGMLNVDSDQLNAFGHDDLTLLMTIGDQLALAIEKARLFQAERRRHQEVETLRDTMILLASNLNLDQVLEKILIQLERVVIFDSVCIFLLDKASLYAIAGKGFPDLKQVIGLSRSAGSPLFQEILQTRQPLILTDAQAEPRFEHWGGTEHVRGWMGIPLLVHDQVIGYLALDSRQVAAYDSASADLGQAFANQAAIVIENARLHTKSEWRAEQLTILNKAGRALASSLDLGYVLEQIVIEATTLVDAEGASLLLLEPADDELAFVASVSPASEQLIGARMPASAGIAGRAVQTKQSYLVQDAQHDAHFYPGVDAITQLTTHSLIAVPLITNDKVIGVIEVVNKLIGVFDRADLDVLEALGSSAAIAIENARLFETTRYSQERYQHLFDDSPIAIREEDFSEVKSYLDRLQTAGVKDLNIYFKQNPKALLKCARLVKVIEVNRACLTLYQASEREELLTNLNVIFVSERDNTFRNQLMAMIVGQTAYECETLSQTLSGKKISIWLRFSIAPGYELTWSKVLISIIDITALKQAEAVVKKQRQELRRLSTQLINTQEAERKRLAYDLHDQMGQALTTIGLNLNLLEQELPATCPASIREWLADTSALVDQTLDQTRELSFSLRPSLLDDFGLEATLNWYVKQFAVRSMVEVQLDTIDFEGRLEPPIEIALYRVVQEALTNVARHAKATRVCLQLIRQNDIMTVIIEDDGCGFDADVVANRQVSEPGLGLLGMRERVKALEGRFEVQSQPGQGTKLFVEVPI